MARRDYTAAELAQMIKNVANPGKDAADAFTTEGSFYDVKNFGADGDPDRQNKLNLYWGDELAKQMGLQIADEGQRMNLGRNVLANRNLARLEGGVNNGAFTGNADSWADQAAKYVNTGQLGGDRSATQVINDLIDADKAARGQGIQQGQAGYDQNQWIQNWDTKNAVKQLLARDFSGGAYSQIGSAYDYATEDANRMDSSTDYLLALQNSPWVKYTKDKSVPVYTPPVVAGPTTVPGGGLGSPLIGNNSPGITQPTPPPSDESTKYDGTPTNTPGEVDFGGGTDPVAGGTGPTPTAQGLDDNAIVSLFQQYNNETPSAWQVAYWKNRSASIGGDRARAELSDNATTRTINYYRSIEGNEDPGRGPKVPVVRDRNDWDGASDLYEWLWEYPPNRATMRDKDTWTASFLNNVVAKNGG